MANDLDTFARHLPFIHLGSSLISPRLGPIPASVVEAWVGDGIGSEWTAERS